MKALVLGGNGFVGMNVVRSLVAANHDVVATRKPIANTLFARKLGATLVKADLGDESSLVTCMRGREVVFHCAAHYPRYSLDLAREVETGVQQMRRVVSAARIAGVRRLVLTGTVATVGPPRTGNVLSDERDCVQSESLSCVYHAVKFAIETEALRANGPKLEVVVLLPTGIFGELDVKAGTGFLIVAVGNGMLPYFVDGKINLVDADYLAQAHIAAAEWGKPGKRYIVGGHNLEVSDLLQQVAEILGVAYNSKPIPMWVAAAGATFGEMRAAALKNGSRQFLARELVDVVRYGRWVDTTLARQELRLPPPISLRRTLMKSCNWYVRHRYIRNEGSVNA